MAFLFVSNNINEIINYEILTQKKTWCNYLKWLLLLIIQKEFQRYLKFTLFKYTLGFGAYKDSQENNRIIQQTGGLFIQQISTYKYVYMYTSIWLVYTGTHI